jgi:ATP-binding cassette, subfamily B, bacterial
VKNPSSGTPTPDAQRPPVDSSLRTVLRAIDLGRIRLIMVGFAFLSIICAMSQAILLLVISEIVVAGVQGRHEIHPPLGPSISSTGAIYIAFVALVCFFSSSLLSTYLSSSVGTRVLTQTRLRVITGFFQSNWALQSTERLGHVQQLLGMNSSGTAGLVGCLSGGLQALLMVSALLGVAVVINPIAAIAVLVMGFVLIQVLRPLNILTRRSNRELSTTTKATMMQTTEYTRLARDFRLFGVENRATNRLRDMLNDTGRIVRRTARIGSIAPVLYQSFAMGIVVIGIVILSHQGHAALEKDGIVLILVLRSVSYGSAVQGSIQGFRANQGLLEDLLYDLNRFDEARVHVGGRVPDSFEVDFDSVEYSYDGVNLALGGITMHIPEGKIVGMLGPSGSGKTTISQILLGLREPTAGRATIGGEDAAKVPKTDAHNTVALVPQEPVLLQGSIMDNIRFFRDFDEDEIIEAAKSAHLHEDVIRMSAGYETLVGEGGGALSGGQKQRLAIARALIGTPKLIVLDEPTSAVDGRTEKLIRQTLSQLRGRVTVVIISHRIETTAQCDLLLVLADGKIADFGERDAVLSGSAYQNIVLTRH